MEEIFRIGTVELSAEECRQYLKEKKFLCTSSAVWKICQTKDRFYGKRLFSAGMAGRGRFYAFTAEMVNSILSNKKIKEDDYYF